MDRLSRLGLITILETAPSDGGPDRTIYKITALGRRAAKEWLCKILTTVGADFPEFPAGVSVMTLLSPRQARELLENRAEKIRAELAKLDAATRAAGSLPRVFLLEDEYKSKVLTAELHWLDSVIGDLIHGALNWDASWIKKVAAEFAQPDPTDSGPVAKRGTRRRR